MLLKQKSIDLEIKDSQGRSALHMAVWGRYGGRQKNQTNGNGKESPECCRLLLEAGADPNARDDFNATPLLTACGTGGWECIDHLVKHGADVNAQDRDGASPLHQCFFRGTMKCFERLIRHKPDAALKHFKSDIVPIDGVFRDNMHDMLDYVLNDKEIVSIVSDDPNMTVTQENVERFMH